MAGQNPPRDRFHADFNAQALENEVIPSSPEVLIAQSSTGLTTQPDLDIVPPLIGEIQVAATGNQCKKNGGRRIIRLG